MGGFQFPRLATPQILAAGMASRITQCEEPHELVTPTVAALLAEFVEKFGPMQDLAAERIGIGIA